MSFLPWWLGAPALAAPTFLFYALTRRPMGVSGALGRVLHWRASSEEDRAFASLEDEAELQRALREATLEEFGEAAAAEVEPAPPASSEGEARSAAPLPVRLNALFLACMFVGALVALRVAGLGETGSTSTLSLGGAVGLALGGLLVGFGARFSGGCTSGHGLSGCARFVPRSLVATGVFFSTAIVTACLIWGRS